MSFEGESITFCLPANEVVLKFLQMKQGDQIKSISLGSRFINMGSKMMQGWDNEEWQQRMEKEKERNDRILAEIKEDLRREKTKNQLLENTIQSLESWFSENAEGSKELYDQKYDEVNSSLNPILMKVHSQSNQGSPDMGGMDPAAMAQAMNGMGMDSSQMNNVDPSGPTIDEVD